MTWVDWLGYVLVAMVVYPIGYLVGYYVRDNQIDYEKELDL